MKLYYLLFFLFSAVFVFSQETISDKKRRLINAQLVLVK